MLDELQVTDVALIRSAHLTIGDGLTVITGETGAGKTALLGALKLIVGERADASMVREGAQESQVEARFFGDSFSEDGCVVARTVAASGRSRVRIDGSMAGVTELAQRIGATVDLCGQHEHQRLLKTAEHRAILDDWAADEVAAPFAAYHDAWQTAQDAAQQVEAVRARGAASDEAVGQARFVLQRIDEVDPQPGEYEELTARVAKMANAEELQMALAGAHDALSGDDGAIDKLAAAADYLQRVARVDDSLGQLSATLRDASFAIEDVARDVGGYSASMEYDPQLLEQLQSRLSAMQGLMRQWGPGMDEVLAAREEAAATVAATDGFDEQLASALAHQKRAEEALAQAADLLHDCRAAAAPELVADVTKVMGQLELGSAALECPVDLLPREKWTAAGPDAIEFLFRPGKTMAARPLAKVASGGEISRVMLAIKVVLGALDNVETLVFDEVDAGVGGSAARALADVLVSLARTHQVIVVTHLAQVAALADAQYRVAKTDGDIPETKLEQVSGEARVHEIARMLSGETSDAGLAHARKLLDRK